MVPKKIVAGQIKLRQPIFSLASSRLAASPHMVPNMVPDMVPDRAPNMAQVTIDTAESALPLSADVSVDVFCAKYCITLDQTELLIIAIATILRFSITSLERVEVSVLVSSRWSTFDWLSCFSVSAFVDVHAPKPRHASPMTKTKAPLLNFRDQFIALAVRADKVVGSCLFKVSSVLFIDLLFLYMFMDYALNCQQL